MELLSRLLVPSCIALQLSCGGSPVPPRPPAAPGANPGDPATPGAPPGRTAENVWVAPPTLKIRPGVGIPPDAVRAANVFAARNEFQSFQIVVTGPADNVSMSLSQLTDANGIAIAGGDLVLYREELTDVLQPTGGDGASGQWPDPLIPDVDPIVGEKRNAFPFSVPAGESRAVLVDLHVPQTHPAGTYHGLLHVTGGATADVPVQLTVWNFAIPSTATLRSAFGMLWNGPCLGHGDGPATESIRARSASSMAGPSGGTRAA